MGRETRENIEIGPCAKIWEATKRLGGAYNELYHLRAAAAAAPSRPGAAGSGANFAAWLRLKSAMMRLTGKSSQPISGRRKMIKIAWLPLLLLPLPALGQTDQAQQSTPPAPVSTIPPSRSVLLHHQPTEGVVIERETQEFGAAEAHRIHTKEQDEIDEIYSEVMRRSTQPEAK